MNMLKKLEAVVMCLEERCKVSYMRNMSQMNRSFAGQRANTNRKHLIKIVNRQVKFIEHVMRKD